MTHNSPRAIGRGPARGGREGRTSSDAGDAAARRRRERRTMSTTTNFQTVRLSRGKHRSSDDGACVMELASMIAGEPFTDRPQSVCRTIAALLRSYNDMVRGSRRQDLYRLASDVIGTRADRTIEEARIRHCLAALDELDELRSQSLLWRLRTPAPSQLRGLLETPLGGANRHEEFMAAMARVLVGGGEPGHDRALALVDELVGIGAPDTTAVPGSVPRPVAAT